MVHSGHVLRSALRGTRQTIQRRLDYREHSTPYSDPDTPTPLGHALQLLTEAVHKADLTPSELLVLTDYYGLNGFPAPLTNAPDALVGSVATASDKQAARPAGRTTVTKLLTSAEDKLAAILNPLPLELTNLVRGPEPDPAKQSWVLTPPATGVPLTAAEHAAVLALKIHMDLD